MRPCVHPETIVTLLVNPLDLSIGDNYMAVAGVPRPRSNHARMATKFALDMVTATGRLRSRLPAPFSIRVGLHSGAVMAGVIGTRKFAYDVWGDTVNIGIRSNVTQTSVSGFKSS
jgi:class 3 adenylate cyclase